MGGGGGGGCDGPGGERGPVFCGVDPHVKPETLEHLIRSEWAWRWETGELLRGLVGLHRAP